MAKTKRMSNLEEEREPLVEEDDDEEQQENAAANQSGCVGGGDQSQEWEVMAGAWLRAFPEAREVNAAEVEAWIDSNRSFLPSELKSMERSELIERLLSIQNILRIPSASPDHHRPPPPPPPPEEKAPRHMNYPSARFQRTDLWLPVYAWLESLKTDEVVNSNVISEWLANNPDIREQLSSKHSKYHLTHYIKKCHMKILKRREKLKGPDKPLQAILPSVGKIVAPKLTELPACSFLFLASYLTNPFSNIPKDGDLYHLKRNEASRKYEILVAFEKHLLVIFPRHPNMHN